MKCINETQADFANGAITKQQYIESMHEAHHARLHEFAEYIPNTNIRKIEIEDGEVIMTSRDRGVRISCPAGDLRSAPMEILNFYDYEKEETSMIEKLITAHDTFFDIGANIGWNAINIAAAQRAASVYCFEPIPLTFRYLERNIELNAVRNVTAHNFGFSDQTGTFPFYYYPGGSVNASSVNLSNRDDVQSVACAVTTLDEFTSETDLRVDVIKCDVEGAELLVFRGGIGTLARHKPIVFSEILRKWSAKFNYDPNEIFELFQQLGYRTFTVSHGRLRGFDRMDEQTPETNFFFLHTDKHADLIWRNEAV